MSKYVAQIQMHLLKINLFKSTLVTISHYLNFHHLTNAYSISLQPSPNINPINRVITFLKYICLIRKSLNTHTHIHQQVFNCWLEIPPYKGWVTPTLNLPNHIYMFKSLIIIRDNAGGKMIKQKQTHHCLFWACLDCGDKKRFHCDFFLPSHCCSSTSFLCLLPFNTAEWDF